MQMEKLEIVKQVAEESLKQEKERLELLQMKSQNLIKYASFTIGVLNTIIVLMLAREYITKNGVSKIVIVVDFPLALSLVLAVVAQVTLKVLYYPTGIQILEDMNHVECSSLTVDDYEVYRLRCMHEYSLSLSRANTLRA